MPVAIISSRVTKPLKVTLPAKLVFMPIWLSMVVSGLAMAVTFRIALVHLYTMFRPGEVVLPPQAIISG
ncbi:hypothetical protein D3C87_1717460 [compost metagenome]